MSPTNTTTRLEAGRRVFTHILVGVDGSDGAREAARQAALLLDPGGGLELLAVWDTATTLIGGTGTHIPPYYDEDLQRAAAEQAAAAARDWIASSAAPATSVVRGSAAGVLLAAVADREATLVALGAGTTGRLLGAVEGAVMTELVHRATCSVLVARPAGQGFPHRIVVGVDGSLESALAYAAACYLAERFGADQRAIVAWGGPGADERLVAAITRRGHEDSRLHPTDALVRAADEADLLIVGSRGLSGVRSLGSVSERVAHRAACSTLIVRPPLLERIADELGAAG